MIKHLKHLGCKVIVIAPRDESSDKLIREGCEYYNIKIDNKGTNPFKDIKLYFDLKRYYKSIHPDFIFHYTIKPNIYGSYAAHQLSIPAVAVVSGAGYTFTRKNLLNLLVKNMYRTAANGIASVWFLNREDQMLFTQNHIVPVSKTMLLPGEGINLDAFRRTTAYPGRENGEMIFALTARLLWDKGVGVYIEAARKIKEEYPHIEFWVLGFLDSKNPLAIKKEQIEDWHNEGVIKYLGSTDNVKSFLEKIDCFVLPSYYKEGIPRSLLEAASMEIPIITTDNVGCKEVVDEGVNGYLCEKKNVMDLTSKMRKMIEIGRDKRREMGQQGRLKAEADFDERLVVKYYTDILEDYFK